MAYLLAKDTANGAEGSVVVTRNGKNYVVAGMRNITTNAEIQNSDMRVIGPRTIHRKHLLWHQPVDGYGSGVH